jgi:hypothetical protein
MKKLQMKRRILFNLKWLNLEQVGELDYIHHPSA